MPKSISINVDTDDVIKAAELGGFTVTPAEASRWLRENGWQIEEFFFGGVYAFMAKTMRFEFPEPSLRDIGEKIDSVVDQAVDFYAAEMGLEWVQSCVDEEMLDIVRRFRQNHEAAATVTVEMKWKGRSGPKKLVLHVQKRGEDYSAEIRRPRPAKSTPQ
jgi:hypothetical protein